MQQRVRAVIITQDSVLLIKRRKARQTYWVFPGGGIEDGETAEQALDRECREELGTSVEIKRLWLQAPCQKASEKQDELFYLCVLPGDVAIARDAEFTPEWVPLALCAVLDVRPARVRDRLYAQFGWAAPKIENEF